MCAALCPVGTVVRACESTRVRRRGRFAACPARGQNRSRGCLCASGSVYGALSGSRAYVRRYTQVRRQQRRVAVDSPDAVEVDMVARSPIAARRL